MSSALHADCGKQWLGAAALALAALIVYAPSLRGQFLFDDPLLITENPLIHARDGLAKFWFSTEAPDYFPLTSTTWWIEWRLWGNNPLGYHLVNVALHATTGILLWRILRRLGIAWSWAAAMLFVVHPVNVASVAWISETKNTLAMVLACAAALLYLRDEDDRKPPGAYIAAILIFLLALLAKTAVVMWPAAMGVLVAWRRGRWMRRDLVRMAPFFALSLTMGLVTIWFQHHRAMDAPIERAGDLWGRIAGAGWAECFYLFKALVPINLMPIYPRWSIDPGRWFAWIPLAALITAAGIGWRLRRRPYVRGLIVGVGLHAMILLPVLGLVDMQFMRFSFVADHWQYPAIICVLAAVTAGAGRISRRWRGFAAGMVALITVAFAGLAYSQAHHYRDAGAYWKFAAVANPRAWIAQNNLGTFLMEQGRFGEAAKRFALTLELNPAHREAPLNLALAHERLGEPARAIAEVHRLIERVPDHAQAHYQLGRMLAAAGDTAGALRAYESAIAADPKLWSAHNDLGALLADAGRLDEAIGHYRRAIELLGDSPHAVFPHFNLGNALASRGDWAGAAQEYLTAVDLAPRMPQPRERLSEAQAHLRR